MIRVVNQIEARAWIFVLLVAALTRWVALDAVPPGIKYDTTSSGVYALNVVFNGTHPFFINPSGAPEPLMVYLQALAIYLFGVNAFALRFLSATIGIVVVALVYALAKETTRNYGIALVAAFTLAVAVEPINVTRTGLRATLVPLAEMAWLLWFWRGWRRGHWLDFVVAGAILGLGMYTYIATLAVAVVAIGLWVHQFLFARPQWLKRLGQFALMIVVVVILVTPRLIFQITFPSAAMNRTSEVSIFQNPAIQTVGLGGVVVGRLLDYVRMFGIAWQGELYNVLHQPLLDPFLFGCFLFGVIVCLTRLQHIEWAWALLMLAVMLLPDLLGANEPTPNELRTVGIIPPTYFLVGTGFVFLLDMGSRRTWLRTWTSVIMTLALMVSAVIGLQAYFVDFAAAARTGPDEDYNRTEIAEAHWITQQSEPVFLPLNEYARSPVHYLTGERAPQLQSAINGDGSLDSRALPNHAWVLLPVDTLRPRTEGRAYVDDPALYVSISGDRVFILPPANNDLPTLLNDRAPNEEIRDALGNIVARAFLVADPAGLFKFSSPPTLSLSAQLSKGITVVAATLDDSQAKPGATIGVSLYWQTLHPLADDHAIFAHVLDTTGNLLTGIDVIPALGAYPTYLWKPGEIVSTHHELKIPTRADAGKYTIEVGMYNVLNGNRLDVLDAQGQPVDSRVIVGAFKVTSNSPATYVPSHNQRAEFNHSIALMGFDQPATVNPGTEAKITLYWQSLATLSDDYTVFVHLLDASGNIVAQADHQPKAGHYPTSIWDVDEQVRDDLLMDIPTDLPNGQYRLDIGWYDLKTGNRLLLGDGTDHILLNVSLEVKR